jgi:hypothetical protein
MRANEFTTEAIRQRLDPKCWTGKHKEGTKIKGGVRVNNCVPNESLEEEQLDELTFMGMSPCTKDCSGHRAGYKWSKARGGISTASQSNSFNKGAEIAKAGY